MFGIVELDSSQVLRVVLGLIVSGQCDCLAEMQADGFVHWVRINTAAGQIGFGADDEEGLALVQGIQPDEIGEAPVHQLCEH